MKHYLVIMMMILMAPFQVHAATTVLDIVFNDSSPHIDLDNGRTYYLVGSVVIERIRVSQIPLRHNVFDFDNGVVIHNFDDKDACQNSVTAFSSLPAGRSDDVKTIGCRIYAQEKRLAKRGDELDYFNTKFCQGAQK